MTIKENIYIGIEAIKGNLTRTVITCLIITVGITALVGILTAIDGVKSAVNNNFSQMGSNSFTISDKAATVRFGGRMSRLQYNKVSINYNQALAFKENYQYPAKVSISAMAGGALVVRYSGAKTDNNVQLLAVDDEYLNVSGYTIASGRNFSQSDLDLRNQVAIIGKDIAARLFRNESAIGKYIQVGAQRYLVIGLLKEKGSSFGFGGDRVVYIPITTAKSRYFTAKTSFSITCQVLNPEELDLATAQAIVDMRKIRKLSPDADDNFEIERSDSLAAELIKQLSMFTLAATFIALITLLGAAIGLMNIMLVSVTERTREIGIRKALGATPTNIRRQFLTEALVICQLGGIGGILLGILVGNIVSGFVGGGFIVPWLWMSIGITLCFIVGLLAGIYPANKAAALDPIEALRYE